MIRMSVLALCVICFVQSATIPVWPQADLHLTSQDVLETPGVVIIQPDFPELKEGWPFLRYENEYLVDTVTSYVLTANAANVATKSPK